MAYTRWTTPEAESRLREAVAQSISIAGVLQKLGLVAAGGNFRNIKFHITRLDLDVSHHKGQTWKKDDYRDPDNNSNNSTWKKTLIRERGHQCERCKLTEWLGFPIPLELEHKNGLRDNVRENLELLCNNCHALTPTFRRQKASLASVVQLAGDNSLKRNPVRVRVPSEVQASAVYESQFDELCS